MDQPRIYTEAEILDLIEDFLVNHFGLDEVKPGHPNLFEMLKHISDLVDLRGPHNNCSVPRLCLHLRSLRAALEFGASKQAMATLRDLERGLGCPEEPQELKSLLERKYIALGFMYSGSIGENEIAGRENELEQLLNAGIVTKRNCSNLSYELAPHERLRLIRTFDLSQRWQEGSPAFRPNDEHGEIADVLRECDA